MVSPILILAIGLGGGFLISLLGEKQVKASLVILFSAIIAMTSISGLWLTNLLAGSTADTAIFTAGFAPPYAIALSMGLAESLFTTLIGIAGILSAVSMTDTLIQRGRHTMTMLLILVMALDGIVMTRDVFNMFVFFEIAVIATAGLVLLLDTKESLGAGFRYLAVSGIISSVLLLGILFAYHFSGTLSIDLLQKSGIASTAGGFIAMLLIVSALLLELKPFPANGWALDLYTTAHPGFGFLFSTASSGAGLYALYKVTPAEGFFPLALVIVGLISFFGSNLVALKQDNDRRLLGYSSIAQIGLMVAVIGMKPLLGSACDMIFLGFFINNYIAKAGLFFLSNLINERSIISWSALRGYPIFIGAAAIFMTMLAGLPPFPGFYAKWDMALLLAQNGWYAVLSIILAASLLESVYLFRWFGYILKRERPETTAEPRKALHLSAIVMLAAAAAITAGVFSTINSGAMSGLPFYPVLFAALFIALDFLPAWVKNSIAILGLTFYAWFIYPSLTEFRLIFGLLFLLGGVITLLAGYAYGGRRVGFYPSAILMFAGLISLVEATTTLQFFFAWEIMTAGSYFLILRGKKSEPHALSYMIFSLAGAFSMLAGFVLAGAYTNDTSIAALAHTGPFAPIIFILIVIGFMTKTASLGLHIWLPGAHAEAEGDVSPMVSAILLKAGLFGLIIVMLLMGDQQIGGISAVWVMSWIGALTALIGNLMSAFEEDAKRLLAYSSIGQLGYALFGLSLMSHLGWLVAILFAVNHFLYKALLFLAIGGVAMRTKTRDMYKMGGLIKVMPFSFISVLIGIIALSGVPPLSGFGGKWLFYNAVAMKGWYLQAVLIFVSGTIAFLYCFRLIHTVFLGQLKDNHRKVKEAPFWMLVPQYVILAIIMSLSLFPGILLRRVGIFLSNYFPEGALRWENGAIYSDLGYWHPVSIMIIVCCIFGAVLLWILFVNRRAQKVKQFNIVYSAERPERPETTHFAYNFFAPYRKSLGWLVTPYATAFWNGVSETAHGSADLLRRIYTGNVRSYMFHTLAYLIVLFIAAAGGR